MPALIVAFSVFSWGLFYFSQGLHMRVAAVKSLTINGLFVFGVTEVLSIFSWIATPQLIITWGTLAALPLVFLFRNQSLFAGVPNAFRKKCAEQYNFHRLISIYFLCIFTVLLTVALVSPPNNWDSMTYHMSRVSHWALNGSVRHYPTTIARQLYISPWTEYAILNLQVLSDGDRLANLVQFMSYFGAGICASLIAAQIGLSRRLQIFSAAFAMTAPMTILQATSTQTDMTAAFWCAACVFFMGRKAAQIKSAVFWVGITSALALFTKTSSVFFLIPFGVAWVIAVAHREGAIRTSGAIAACIVIALSVHFAHFQRNYKSFGNIAGPQRELKMMNNDGYTPDLIFVNVVRNMAINFGTPVQRINSAIASGIRKSLVFFGLNPDEPKNAVVRYEFEILKSSTHEDIAANPIHATLLLIALFLLFRRGLGKTASNIRQHYLLSALGFCILCTFMRSSPYNIRLHVPIFVLFAPAVIALYTKALRPSFLNALIALLCFTSCYWVFCNYSRPLIRIKPENPASIFLQDRESLYFTNRTYLQSDYSTAINALSSRNCTDVGLMISIDSWEYPLWALTKLRGTGTQFRHLTSKIEKAPCAIITGEPNTAPSLSSGGIRFNRMSNLENISLYWPSE